ncbi:MAG TPA: hypothetical protein DCZ40_11400 [Lachnospiraceae bacterium]|nr:hypothetical protein [Lachnospiraceae bacterium]
MAAFHTMMNQIDDSDKKELVIRIRGISGLDIEILDGFFEIVDEIDAFLHPKWQQDILVRMVE